MADKPPAASISKGHIRESTAARLDDFESAEKLFKWILSHVLHEDDSKTHYEQRSKKFAEFLYPSEVKVFPYIQSSKFGIDSKSISSAPSQVIHSDENTAHILCVQLN